MFHHASATLLHDHVITVILFDRLKVSLPVHFSPSWSILPLRTTILQVLVETFLDISWRMSASDLKVENNNFKFTVTNHNGSDGFH